MPVWIVGVEATIAAGVRRHLFESAALSVESEILAGDGLGSSRQNLATWKHMGAKCPPFASQESSTFHVADKYSYSQLAEKTRLDFTILHVALHVAGGLAITSSFFFLLSLPRVHCHSYH